jgi:hypothetical protein
MPRSRSTNPHTNPQALAVAMLCAAVGSASAQRINPAIRTAGTPLWANAQLIEQGLDDESPLSSSLRVAPQQLGAPTGFIDLFRIGGAGSNLFGRFDGGVAALFPRSTYAQGRQGTFATVPPDTRFVIGEPPAWLIEQFAAQDPLRAASQFGAGSARAASQQAASISAHSNRIDARIQQIATRPANNAIDTRATASDEDASTESSVGPTRVNLTRITRPSIGDLLRQAADAEAARERRDHDDGDQAEPAPRSGCVEEE